MPDFMFKKRNVWFFKGDLVSIEHNSKSQGIVAVKNWTQDRIMYMATRDFVRLREHAYTYKEVAELLNYASPTLKTMILKGIIPGPMGRTKNGEIKQGYPAYFSEERIYTIREVLAGRHIGRARKDGLITNNLIVSESELSARMNKAYMVYVRTNDGVFVPTFPETI